jgi:hypothetical protein
LEAIVKAIVIKAPGGLDQVERVDLPDPADDQTLRGVKNCRAFWRQGHPLAALEERSWQRKTMSQVNRRRKRRPNEN